MGFIKEPKGVDFSIQSEALTDKDKIEIGRHVADYKAKQRKKKIAAKKRKRHA